MDKECWRWNYPVLEEMKHKIVGVVMDNMETVGATVEQAEAQ